VLAKGGGAWGRVGRLVCIETPRAELALDMTPSAARRARAFVRMSRCPVHEGTVLDDALLLVTEMVANAVMHGAPPLSIAVECDKRTVEVRVRDGSAVRPKQRRVTAEDEDGRGLLLVSSVADSWGVDALASGGKEVWVRLRKPASGHSAQ
jgi:anti-sigma regulatory factor (Ser/Thr protein kinase)